ncbi:hypothetical protein D6D01_06223 [Aureobasidium pullulans]|uniref:Uncharacterized protein n=1 Tax=Aureobasidium pullulans TaxID=5580 RepID=A0A4S9L108_AURPU|nr:hypothetical protein D6D01_06223 [Aureobasidium pullulans]
MPMTWDAAADAKLFTVVMAVYDIKISGAQNDKIAQMMGSGKSSFSILSFFAITHRLSKIRAQGAGVSPSSTIATPKSRKAHAAKFSGTPSKSSNGKGKGKGKDLNGLSATHTRTTLMQDNGEDDEEDFATPTHAPKKRKMEPKSEDEAEDLGDAIDFEALHKKAGKGKGKGAKIEEGLIDLTDHPGDEDMGVKIKKEAAADGFADFNDAEI